MISTGLKVYWTLLPGLQVIQSGPQSTTRLHTRSFSFSVFRSLIQMQAEPVKCALQIEQGRSDHLGIMISCLQSPLFSVLNSPSLLKNPKKHPCKFGKDLSFSKGTRIGGDGESGRRVGVVVCNGWLLPVDPWAPTIDSESIASQLFAASLFPYLGFLYFITKSKSAPKLTLFGFYFLLAFVGATIPAGIYAKVHYGTSLSNVDWLHGGAESLLTLTNLFIVLGLRQALRGTSDRANGKSSPIQEIKEENKSSI